MNNVILKKKYPLKWLEIDSETPSGIVMVMGPEPARFLIGNSKTNTKYQRTAIQLDETQDRPAFSYFTLRNRTGMRGVWFGAASAQLLGGYQGSDSVAGPGRAGIIRYTESGI